MGGALKFLGPLKGPFFKLINGLIKTRIGKAAEDTARILEEVGELVLNEVMGESVSGADNAGKHKSVAERVLTTIKEPGGIEAPAWLLEYLDEYLDDLIGAAVDAAKSSGLFGG